MPGEEQPKPRIEERVLIELGYESYLDQPVAEGSYISGRNFLDSYHSPETRQHTEDMLYGFVDMPVTDPDYRDTKDMITRYLDAYFGPAQDS